MTQEEYNTIIETSQPHKIFNKDWSTYYSLDFADTFLPKSNGYKAKGVYVYDGANLFEHIPIANRKLLSLANNTDLISIITYTFPKEVEADLKKQRVNPAKHEILMFIQANIDDIVNISFKFGSSFNMFLKTIGKNSRDIESKIYKSTIKNTQENLKGGLVHDSMMRFVLKTIGVDEILNIKSKEFQQLRAVFDTMQLKFPAGFLKNEEHPNVFGHGDIELEALTKAGYSKQQIYQIYYGNWLRDFSQVIVPVTIGLNLKDQDILLKNNANNQRVIDVVSSMSKKPSQKKWVEVLHILAVKEFVYNYEKVKGKVLTQNFSAYKDDFKHLYGDFNQDILGLYRPEEHLDNPKDLNDDSIFSDKKLENPIVFNYEYPKGKFNIQKLYAGTNPKSLEIDENSNMKRYLLEDLDDGLRPSAFTYFEQQLRLARKKGRNRDGFRHFGAALHVLEDYFAHSNFIEIALIKNEYTKVFPWVQLSTDIVSIKKGKDKAFEIPVVTGLFGTDDTLASITPKLASELFPKDFDDYYNIKFGERTFFDAMFVTLLESIAQNQKSVPENEKIKYLGLTIQDILNMFNNYLKWRDGWAKQKENKYYGWFLEGVSRTFHFIGQSLQFYNNILFNILLNTVDDGIKEEQTRSNQNFGTDPTHTQIAKDSIDHPLNPLAGILAVKAVYDIGRKMKTGMPIDSLVAYAKKTYFNHPSRVTWMDKTVKTWAKQNANAVRKSESKTNIYHHEKQSEEILEQFRKEIDNLKNPPKN